MFQRDPGLDPWKIPGNLFCKQKFPKPFLKKKQILEREIQNIPEKILLHKKGEIALKNIVI